MKNIVIAFYSSMSGFNPSYSISIYIPVMKKFKKCKKVGTDKK